jgi:hypothetical protein
MWKNETRPTPEPSQTRGAQARTPPRRLYEAPSLPPTRPKWTHKLLEPSDAPPELILRPPEPSRRPPEPSLQPPEPSLHTPGPSMLQRNGFCTRRNELYTRRNELYTRRGRLDTRMCLLYTRRDELYRRGERLKASAANARKVLMVRVQSAFPSTLTTLPTSDVMPKYAPRREFYVSP